jgi:carbon storage regulator
MLNMSRRKGEEIIIDGRIRIVVVKCHGGTVRLAIDAPKGVSVDRREVHERKRKELRDGDQAT